MNFPCWFRGVTVAALCWGGALALAAQAAEVRSETTQPQMVTWEKEMLEFKPAPGTREIHGAFRFKNTSQTPFIVSGVTPNCGCLKIASFPKTTAPGQSGAIKFTYQAAGKEGLQTARIEVESGDAKSVAVVATLRMRLELSPRVTLRPGLVLWNGAAKSKEVAIALIDPALALEPGGIKASDGFTATLLPGDTSRSPRTFRLRLERPASPGHVEGWATLSINDGSGTPLERKIRLIAD